MRTGWGSSIGARSTKGVEAVAAVIGLLHVDRQGLMAAGTRGVTSPRGPSISVSVKPPDSMPPLARCPSGASRRSCRRGGGRPVPLSAGRRWRRRSLPAPRYNRVSRAGVTQSVECLLPKQNVAGSSPVSRSTFPRSDQWTPSLHALERPRLTARERNRPDGLRAARRGLATHTGATTSRHGGGGWR